MWAPIGLISGYLALDGDNSVPQVVVYERRFCCWLLVDLCTVVGLVCGCSSETIARILQPYNRRVAHKLITTLRRLPTNVKDKDKPEDMQGAVYKVKCCYCQASYTGETGRNLSTRLTDHKRAARNGEVNNHIADHFQTKHQTDWDTATCITYSTDYYQCPVL